MADTGWERPQAQPHHIRRAIITWAIATVVGILVVLWVPPHLVGLTRSAGNKSNDYNLTMMAFTVAAVPVFMLVIVFALDSLYHFRSHDMPMTDASPIQAGRGIQITWVVVSAILVMGLFAWGLIFLDRIDAAPAPGTNVLHVDVTGEQWNWDFTYPQYGNAQSETLEVPINRPILFQITSLDVQHSFSVPAFAIKEDAIPGQFTYIRVTPTALGDYTVRCYELCGMFHTYMQEPVRVVSAAQFATWVGAQKTGYPWGIGGASTPNYSPSKAPSPGPHSEGFAPGPRANKAT